MELSQGGTYVASVEDLRRIAGRHTFHYEPDLCGSMNVVLDERSSDRVTFSCDIALAVGEVYTLSDGETKAFQVKITRSTDSHHTAWVVDA